MLVAVRREGAAGCGAPTLFCEHRLPVQADGWSFSLIYVVTFGGFIGLSGFLPTYFYDQFKVTKIESRPTDDAPP